MSRKVLITGITSFTGCHIARAFAENGDEVWATLSSSKNNYTDALKSQRLIYSKVENFVENSVFGSESFLRLIQENKFDVFVNHGADIENYRSPNFDYRKSFLSSTDHLRETVIELKNKACKRILHSGSVFEPGEGSSLANQESTALSIYGVTKNLVWQCLKYFCNEQKLNVTKIVIPNPVGLLENVDRLTPFFVKEWKNDRTPHLTTPKITMDNLPAEWLAQIYLEESFATTQTSIRRPQGIVCTNKEWVEMVASSLTKRLNKELKFSVDTSAGANVYTRQNTEPVKEMKDNQALNKFWNQWSDYLSRI
jgi:nucleoside-diphosphate-sugar epimerase